MSKEKLSNREMSPKGICYIEELIESKAYQTGLMEDIKDTAIT